MRRKMGECLVQAGLLSAESLRTALAEQRRTGERLGVVLARLGVATETDIATALAAQLGFPYVDLERHPPDPAVVGVIPKATALKHVVVAVGAEKGTLTVAMSDPLLLGLVQELERETGFAVRQVVATRRSILAAIAGAEGPAPGIAVAGAQSGSVPSPAPEIEVEETLRSILSRAAASGATDVLVEPTGQSVLVRARVDGVLRRDTSLPALPGERLIRTLKQLAGMRLNETRLPQDGRLRYAAGQGPEVEFRVSTLHTLWGEKLVLRRWGRPGAPPRLDDLGLSTTMLEEVRGFAAQKRGLVLIVGPAGGGVHATLAALAADVAAARSGHDDIVSIEDPIEYQIVGVTQTSAAGANDEEFASRLRSILRQQPDVVIVGVLRGADTAKVALSAAARALVIAAVQADNLPSAIDTLLTLGLDRPTMASSLKGVVVQRLARRLCASCRRISSQTAGADGPPTAEPFFDPAGCDECHHTGYRGRIGLYQAVAISADVRQAIEGDGRGPRLTEVPRQGAGVSLAEDALAKAKAGVISKDELLAAVSDEALAVSRPLCAACGAAVDVAFLACPSCGTTIGSACVYCGRAMRAGWRFCPYCARRTDLRQAGRDRNRRSVRTVLS